MRLDESILDESEIVSGGEEKLPNGILARVRRTVCILGKRNGNNRVYSGDVWENVLANPETQKKLKNRQILGEFEHPKEVQLKLDKDRTSHVVSNLFIEKNVKLKDGTVSDVVKADFDLLPTEAGKFIHILHEAGVKVPASTRADGELEEALDESGDKYMRVIPEKFNWITIDHTGDPSCQATEPDSVINAVKKHYESKEISKNLAVALLESLGTDAAKKLESLIESDKEHSDCKCKLEDKGCSGKCPRSVKENESSSVKDVWNAYNDSVDMTFGDFVAELDGVEGVDSTLDELIGKYKVAVESDKKAGGRGGLADAAEEALVKELEMRFSSPSESKVVEEVRPEPKQEFKKERYKVVIPGFNDKLPEEYQYTHAKSKRAAVRQIVSRVVRGVEKLELDNFKYGSWQVREENVGGLVKSIWNTLGTNGTKITNIEKPEVSDEELEQLRKEEMKSEPEGFTEDPEMDEAKKCKKKALKESETRYAEVEVDTKDKGVLTAEVTLLVDKVDFGTDADGNKGEKRISVLDMKVDSLVDSEGKEVPVTDEIQADIYLALRNVDLKEAVETAPDIETQPTTTPTPEKPRNPIQPVPGVHPKPKARVKKIVKDRSELKIGESKLDETVLTLHKRIKELEVKQADGKELTPEEKSEYESLKKELGESKEGYGRIKDEPIYYHARPEDEDIDKEILWVIRGTAGKKNGEDRVWVRQVDKQGNYVGDLKNVSKVYRADLYPVKEAKVNEKDENECMSCGRTFDADAEGSYSKTYCSIQCAKDDNAFTEAKVNEEEDKIETINTPQDPTEFKKDPIKPSTKAWEFDRENDAVVIYDNMKDKNVLDRVPIEFICHRYVSYKQPEIYNENTDFEVNYDENKAEVWDLEKNQQVGTVDDLSAAVEEYLADEVLESVLKDCNIKLSDFVGISESEYNLLHSRVIRKESLTEALEEKRMGFRKLVKALSKKGAKNPKALAASIGRKKYGKKRFQKMAKAGMKEAIELAEAKAFIELAGETFETLKESAVKSFGQLASIHSDVTEGYASQVLSLSRQLKESKEVNAKVLQEKKSLEEALVSKGKEVKALSEKLEAKTQEFTERVSSIEVKRTEELQGLQEAHTKALLNKYLSCKLELTGLSLPEPVRALLEQCKTEDEINETLEGFKKAVIESGTFLPHSVEVSEDKDKPKKSNPDRVDMLIEAASKGITF